MSRKKKTDAEAVNTAVQGFDIGSIMIAPSVMDGGKWFRFELPNGQYVCSVRLRPHFGNMDYLSKRTRLFGELEKSKTYEDADDGQKTQMRLQADDHARVGTCFVGIKDVWRGETPAKWSENLGFQLLSSSPPFKAFCLAQWNDNDAFTGDPRKKN